MNEIRGNDMICLLNVREVHISWFSDEESNILRSKDEYWPLFSHAINNEEAVDGMKVHLV